MIIGMIDPYTGLHEDDPLPVDLRWYSAAVFRVQELEAAYAAILQPNGFATIKSGFNGSDGRPEQLTVTYNDRQRLKKAILALQPLALNRIRYFS